jgi:hypothetical protein
MRGILIQLPRVALARRSCRRPSSRSGGGSGATWLPVREVSLRYPWQIAIRRFSSTSGRPSQERASRASTRGLSQALGARRLHFHEMSAQRPIRPDPRAHLGWRPRVLRGLGLHLEHRGRAARRPRPGSSAFRVHFADITGAVLALNAASAASFNEAFSEGRGLFKAGDPLATISFTVQTQ